MTLTNLLKTVGGNAAVNEFDVIGNGNYGPTELHNIGKAMASACMARRPVSMSEYEFAHRAEEFFQNLIWENFENSNLVHSFQFCIMELKKYQN